jgi:hypothetical protein
MIPSPFWFENKLTDEDSAALGIRSRRGARPVPRGGPAPSVLEESDTATIVFERKHLPKLEATVRFLKKQDGFSQVLLQS